MVLRRPAVPCAKPYTECRIPNHCVSAAASLCPLGEANGIYSRHTNTKRCSRSRLIGSGSLLSDDLNKLDTHSDELHILYFIVFLCARFLKIFFFPISFSNQGASFYLMLTPFVILLSFITFHLMYCSLAQSHILIFQMFFFFFSFFPWGHTHSYK